MSLARWLPGLANLLRYRREWLAPDLLAGLSFAAIQIPIVIACAQTLGLLPHIAEHAAAARRNAFASPGDRGISPGALDLAAAALRQATSLGPGKLPDS